MQSHRGDYSQRPDADSARSGAGASPRDGGAAIEAHDPDAESESAAPIRLDARSAAGRRLDRFVADAIDGVSRTRVQRWIALGAITVDGEPAPASRRLRGHETLEVTPLPHEADRAFEPDAIALAVVHEDADLLIVDKPAGLVVHPAPGHWRGTLMNGLLHARPDSAHLPRAGIVHRLDKDTSGLLMVARTERAFDVLTAALAARAVSRRYLAVVEGMPPERFTVDAPIGRDPRNPLRMAVATAGRGRTAVTHLWRLAGGASTASVECRLDTGRTHQIRVHLAHRGHPLVGDVTYGGRPRGDFARQALHAWRLELSHPGDGRPVTFSSPLPDDLRTLVAALGLPQPHPVAGAALPATPTVRSTR